MGRSGGAPAEITPVRPAFGAYDGLVVREGRANEQSE
jgi:hypothetical protein